MTFYTSATGAGWIVPKKYVEKVGDEGFKKAPIGAGPYKFVSFTPGLELVFEAFDGYWRKTPNVKRLVFRVIPDESTRLAALKRGEVDIAYSIRGELAEELAADARADPEADRDPGTILAVFPRPVGPEVAVARPARAPGRVPRDRSQHHQPGADARLFADHRQHHPGQLRALLGSRRRRSTIRPRPSSCWRRPAIPTASTPATTTAMRRMPISPRRCSTTWRRSASAPSCGRSSGPRSSRAIRRRTTRTSSRALSGAFGNAATRLADVRGQGRHLRLRQLSRYRRAVPGAGGRARSQRSATAMLHKMQQLVHERTIYAPIWQLAFINGARPARRRSRDSA